MEKENITCGISVVHKEEKTELRSVIKSSVCRQLGVCVCVCVQGPKPR
jgi:hypothetical protein